MEQVAFDSTSEPIKIGVLTSGGDAQGMNAAVRAVVRTSLARGARPFAILDGWSGAVKGGDSIRPMTWTDASGILAQGGTVIGTARCPEFREYEGRHAAALHLIEQGIDRLVVIGGDGSLSGTEEFRTEWAQHLSELVNEGQISAEQAKAHERLYIVGLVGSIDNDMVGTDMTIGADTALHRIVDAIDQISSTAASHQRTFIVEVMGHKVGWLTLYAGIAGGADIILIPEIPYDIHAVIEALQKRQKAGSRFSIIVVAEGAISKETAALSKKERKTKLAARRYPSVAYEIGAEIEALTGQEVRVTVPGHTQRGGAPNPYDRVLSTRLGARAAKLIYDGKFGQMVVIRNNEITSIPLEESAGKLKVVDPNSSIVEEARLLGLSFGDR